MQTIDGILYARMIRFGAVKLKENAKRINDLNVFPIPDGDTGDNMLLTMMGGVPSEESSEGTLSRVAKQVSDGMLLSARGNSGVILSQFFEGLKLGFQSLETADAEQMTDAFRRGVKQAYGAVMKPQEGTILTVIREATEYAAAAGTDSPEAFLSAFLDEAQRSLQRTPDLLPVLKKAGVVDSGAAGLLTIMDGMLRALLGEDMADLAAVAEGQTQVDLDAFGADDVLEFGYCTELLLRLQTAKVDVATFHADVITEYLKTVGDSIVTVQSGSVVKLHVHTKTPHEVLAFCQQFGEFLKVKIENMQLQHNSAVTEGAEHLAAAVEDAPRRPFGLVAVASGEGLKQTFLDRGCDVVVDGGQSMNPSAEDFLEAFRQANADVIFVFPNNSNIILAAEQAAGLYTDADVRVIPSRALGQGYAALAMYDTTSGDADVIEEELKEAMEDVLTAEVSRSVRDADFDGLHVTSGDYIGFMGKELLSVEKERFDAVCQTVEKMELGKRDILILVCGREAAEEEVERLSAHFDAVYPSKEIYILNGGQDVYDYIMIVE